jgi:CSLREA domain-containing protein
MRTNIRQTTYKALWTCACLLLSVAGAQATILTVTKTADTDDGVCSATDCSLREAIDVAAPGDLIFFSSLFNSPRTITLTLGTLEIDKRLSIGGPGANLLTIDGSPITYISRSVICVGPVDGTVTLSGMTIANGPPGNAGIENDGDLNVMECHITGNGGTGVVNRGYVGMDNCTISENSGESGGILNVFTYSAMLISNCTISGNTADPTFDGAGGIKNGGSMEITNCTVFGNQNIHLLGGTGGIRHVLSFTTPTETIVRSTIVAGNFDNSGPSDVVGDFTSDGYNFIGSDTSTLGFNSLGDQTGTYAAPLDPLLDPLGNYGGPTPTHRLQGGSPCIDAAYSFGAIEDQRGFARPVDKTSYANVSGGDGSDIGAYELQYSIAVVTGIVLGPKDKPVPGAHVLLRLPNGSIRETITRNDGRFRFSGIRSDATYIIRVRKGQLEVEPQQIAVPDEGIDLILQAIR